jgi:hypothetical protein
MSKSTIKFRCKDCTEHITANSNIDDLAYYSNQWFPFEFRLPDVWHMGVSHYKNEIIYSCYCPKHSKNHPAACLG